MLLEILFLLIFCITAISDIKHRRIPNYFVIILVTIGIINLVADNFPLTNIIGIVFPAIVLLAFSKRHHIGFGDIKLTIAIGLYYGYMSACVILICAMLAGSFCSFLLKRKKQLEIKSMPLAPFIFAFCLLASGIKNIQI